MPAFPIFDILVRGLSSLKMIGIANVFFYPPCFFLFLKLSHSFLPSHPLLFPSLLLYLPPFVAIFPSPSSIQTQDRYYAGGNGVLAKKKIRIVPDSHPSVLRSTAKKFQVLTVNRAQNCKASCSLCVGNNRLFSICSALLASIYCTSPAGEIRLHWAPLGWEQNGPARTSIH